MPQTIDAISAEDPPLAEEVRDFPFRAAAGGAVGGVSVARAVVRAQMNFMGRHGEIDHSHWASRDHREDSINDPPPPTVNLGV